MSCPFKVSDKVVCVDASPGRITRRIELTLGRVYVINRIWLPVADIDAGAVCVAVVGIDLGFNGAGLPVGFDSVRFRKLEEVQAENRLKVTQTQEAGA